MPAKVSADIFSPISEKIKIVLLTTKPIRAANILGPALTNFFFSDNSLTIPRDRKPIGLNLVRLVLRIRKSIAKKAGINHWRVIIKSITSEKVKKPFSLATRLLTLLVEMGHVAYVFIALIY